MHNEYRYFHDSDYACHVLCSRKKTGATIMTATDHIAAAAQIDPTHLDHLWFLGPS